MLTIVPTNSIKQNYYKEVCGNVKKALKPFNHLETKIYDDSEQSGYLIVEVFFGKIGKVDNVSKAFFLELYELPKIISHLNAVNFKLSNLFVRKKESKFVFVMTPKNSQLLY